MGAATSPTPRSGRGSPLIARCVMLSDLNCRLRWSVGDKFGIACTRRFASKDSTTNRNTFTQSFGGSELDASLLMMPLVGFLPPDDPRVRGTVAAIERELMVDGLVLRYRTKSGVDGLPPGEGVFLPCSFWLAHNYTLQNRDAEARALFERLLSLRNDVRPARGRVRSTSEAAGRKLSRRRFRISLSSERL